MQIDANAMATEFQQQIVMLAQRAAQYAGMVDALQKQVAQLQKQVEGKPDLKVVENEN